MIRLQDYILENKRETSSNKERRDELEKWLKGKDYPDYVNTLNKMLRDPKAKTLLQDGFGGDLGDTKFTFRVRQIKPLTLRPTQNEIDVDKSIKHAITQSENMARDMNKHGIIIANMPIVTFRGNYVIDGHHRWSECAMINPEGTMTCFDYDADISPIQMLKAVQGNIAAALAKRDEDPEIPSNKTVGPNLFSKDWDKDKIREYVENKLTDSAAYEYMKHDRECETKEEVVDRLCENIWNLKVNCYPEDKAPSRGEMPQTDKAGQEKGNKQSGNPDKEGSALNRMKDGKFDKKAVK